MYKRAHFISILALVAPCYAQVYQSAPTPLMERPNYFLSFKSGPHLSRINSIPCIYHGHRLFFEDGYCQLPEKAFRTFFSLIITPFIEFKNNGTCLYAERRKNSKWYNVTLHVEESDTQHKQKYWWNIQELTPDQMPMRIPEHAGIIIQLPSHLVEGLENVPQKGHLVINFPRIILKKSLTQEQLDEALEEIHLDSPNTSILCSNPPRIKRTQDKTGIVIYGDR